MSSTDLDLSPTRLAIFQAERFILEASDKLFCDAGDSHFPIWEFHATN